MLREALTGSQYQVVVYLRPHVDWLPSVYLQGVQEGRDFGPEDFWSSIKDEPYLRWTNLIDLLNRESGAEQVIARAYTNSRDSVADFFKVMSLGNPPQPGRRIIRENVSIRAVQAPILRELNSLESADDSQRRGFRAVFQQSLASSALSGLSPFPMDLQGEMARDLERDWSSLVIGQLGDAEAFHVEASRYRGVTTPFAGSSIEDPLVREEVLRSIQWLSLNRERDASLASRVLYKLLKSPKDLPEVTLRTLRGWLRSRPSR